jgi:hypothetical protein
VTDTDSDTSPPAPTTPAPPVAPPPPAPAPPPPSFVYAIGQIEPRFPSLGVEKEFAQAVGRDRATASAAATDRQALQATLAQRANRYLARQLCWVFTVEGLETYILMPRDPADLDLFIEAVRPRPAPGDLDVVVGVLGPIADADQCNGLVLPIVGVD